MLSVCKDKGEECRWTYGLNNSITTFVAGKLLYAETFFRAKYNGDELYSRMNGATVARNYVTEDFKRAESNTEPARLYLPPEGEGRRRGRHFDLLIT